MASPATTGGHGVPLCWAQKTAVANPARRELRRAALKLLGIFAEQLGGLGNQMLVQKQSGEPSFIRRAKEFISLHYGERISSERVAKELHLSRFYFCKLFKRMTGLTLTGYLSRLRVERVKELLLNPNLRISEIAFQAGFESLSHFNRTFLKLAGESPTEYRARLRANQNGP
jgi:AraC-like DNA-binding protein